MGPVTGLVAYLIIWWAVLFTILPIGVRGQWEEGGAVEGTEPGAPVVPQLWKKIAITSAVAGVVWIGLFVAARFGAFDFLLP